MWGAGGPLLLPSQKILLTLIPPPWYSYLMNSKIDSRLIFLLLSLIAWGSLVCCGDEGYSSDQSEVSSATLSGCPLLCSVIADLCEEMTEEDYEQCPSGCQRQMDYEENEMDCNGLDLKDFDLCLNHVYICEDAENCFDYLKCANNLND